jgi:Tfp pilus assembly protein PilO
VSRTYQILLTGIIAVLAVGGYYKLALAPKREQAQSLQEQVLTAQTQLAQTQSMVKTYAGAKQAYRNNYATVVRLGKAIPADDDSRSLLVQLDTAAKRSGIDFDSLDVSSTAATTASTSTPASTTTAPGAVSLGSYSALPLSFGFTGDFDRLENFFSRVERFVTVKGNHITVNGRILKIESLNLQPAENGWPGLQVTIGASAYIVPTTSGAGATPSTSTTTPSPGTTSAASAGSNLR